MKKSLTKIISILIIGMNYFGLFGVSETYAYLSDTETATENSHIAGTLDFSLRDTSDNLLSSPLFNIPAMQKEESQQRIVRVKNDGTLDFQYKVKLENVSGDLCNYLTLKAVLDGNEKYNDVVQNTTFPADFILFSSPNDDWTFTLTLNNDAPESKTCAFDFVFNGVQIGGTGFSDQEIISNIVTAGRWSTQTIRLFPTADSYTKQGFPNDNYGSSNALYIKGGENDIWTWFRFDLSGLPSNATINTATLKAYASTVPSVNLKTGAFHSSDDSWTESGINWSNQPSTNVNLTAVVENPAVDWNSWILTNDVQADFATGDYKSTWTLKYWEHDSGSYVQVRSKEYSGMIYDPYLEITFTAPAATTDHLVINEVYYDVDSPDKGTEGTNEWVEIYNPTNSAVDISNYKITDNSGTERILCAAPVTCSSTTIPAYGFAVVTPDALTWTYWPGIPFDAVKIVLGASIGNGLFDDGDRVILKNSVGTTIDAISYGTDISQLNPPIIDVYEGWSMARILKGYDTDKASDFWANPAPNPGTNPHLTNGEEIVTEEFIISEEGDGNLSNENEVVTKEETPVTDESLVAEQIPVVEETNTEDWPATTEENSPEEISTPEEQPAIIKNPLLLGGEVLTPKPEPQPEQGNDDDDNDDND